METRIFASISLPAMLISLLMTSTAWSAGGGEIITSDPSKHFHPKGKFPSKFTIEAQIKQRGMLPFDDVRALIV